MEIESTLNFDGANFLLRKIYKRGMSPDAIELPRASHHLPFATQKKLLCVIPRAVRILRFSLSTFATMAVEWSEISYAAREPQFDAIGTHSKLRRVQQQISRRARLSKQWAARISFP